MKTLNLLAVLPFVGSMLVACGSADGVAASGQQPGAAGAETATDPTTARAAAAPDGLPAACTAYFDALLARRTQCTSEPNFLAVDAFEGARASALARCLERGANPGTGYTAAFYAKCNEALDTAACGDDDTLVKACWEPRGTLVRGMGCATDDQCSDGYCKLAEGARAGSTCGTCDVPVWTKLDEPCTKDSIPIKDAKCRAGLICELTTCVPAPRLGMGTGTLSALGGKCFQPTSCMAGLGCVDQKCVELPAAQIGESCVSKQCEVGAFCVVAGKDESVCVKIAAVGESCDGSKHFGRTSPPCDRWLECSPTRRCQLPEIFKCG